MEVSELRLNNITIQSKLPQKLLLMTEKKTLKLQGLILKKLVCCTSCFERVLILSVKYSLHVFKVTAKNFSKFNNYNHHDNLLYITFQQASLQLRH